MIVRDLVLLAGFDAQHAREMVRVFAGNFRAAVAHLIHEEPSPSHVR
jgi:hypothetical protein